MSAGRRQYLDDDLWDVLLTAKGVANEYEERGFDDAERALVDDIDYHGNVRGSDEYAECDSGVLLGSMHHGNHEIARRAAWLNAQVRHDGKGADLTYGAVGDAVLHQMREVATAQTALRIGRGKDGRGALVMIDTCAVPEWIPIENRESPGEVKLWSKGERAVRDAVQRLDDDAPDDEPLVFRSDDVLEETSDFTPRHVRRLLGKQADRGLLRKEPDPEDGRRSVWVDTGLAAVVPDESATVRLPPAEIDSRLDAGDSVDDTEVRVSRGDTDISRIDYYTQNVRTFSPGSSPDEVAETDGGTKREPTK